jgi:colanic acid biosynthesis glycosyl transferase WcaI
VVTGFPNYPGGKIYPGYRMSWRHRETIEGVQITRLPLYPSHDDSAIRRVANYVSFALSAAFYCVFQARKADVVYVYQLLTVAAVGALIKLLRRTPVVFDVQDIWPDTLRATGMVQSERVLTAVDLAANWVYRRMDAIVVQSPGFRRLLAGRGVADEKLELIYNWCDQQSLYNANHDGVGGFSADGRFHIVFAGNMGKAQSLAAVLDAADQLRTRFPRVGFVFIGGGVEVDRLKAIAEGRSFDNVTIIPRVAMARVWE